MNFWTKSMTFFTKNLALQKKYWNLDRLSALTILNDFSVLENKKRKLNHSSTYNSFTILSIFTEAYYLEYLKIIIIISIAAIIAIIMLVVAYLLSLNTFKDAEKLSEYECGFDPFDTATRHPFDVHFYVVGILFLIFDIEIALLFPWVIGLKTLNWLGILSMLFVLFILLVGFIYEWHKGALVWPQLN